MDTDSTRYILDHITRQCRELKHDVRNEIGTLKLSLDNDMRRQEFVVQALKEEIDKRLALMDERIVDLQKFKWQAAGVVTFVVTAIELGIYLWVK